MDLEANVINYQKRLAKFVYSYYEELISEEGLAPQVCAKLTNGLFRTHLVAQLSASVMEELSQPVVEEIPPVDVETLPEEDRDLLRAIGETVSREEERHAQQSTQVYLQWLAQVATSMYKILRGLGAPQELAEMITETQQDVVVAMHLMQSRLSKGGQDEI